MPQNTFLETGILDGQPVEAFQVSQSVDAFTAQSDYRITQTGSYTLSGSFNMSGSFVNEFTGQFSTLGLGVAAPTAPIMFHVKDNASGGGDPIALLEANSGTDNARIRLSNTDVTFDLGAYGTAGDDFRIVQDADGTPKIPFISGKDVASYTLVLSDSKVGIGLGASTDTILTNLDAESLQVKGTISGSLVRSTTISASAAGPNANIHGTASHAIDVVTAQTASYVKFENVDTFYSASGQANFSNNISTIQTASAHGFKFGKATAAVVDSTGQTILSGSGGGGMFVGSPDDGEFINIRGVANETILNSGGEIYINAGNRTINKSEFRVSGSGTPQVIVGPPVGNIGSNNPSASLKHDALEFHKSNDVYVGNYDTDSNSRINIIGGGNENFGYSVSSSTDMTMIVNDRTNPNKIIIDTGNRNYGTGTAPGVENFSTGSWLDIGNYPKDATAPRIQYFNISSSQVNTTDVTKTLWELDASLAGLGSQYDNCIINIEVEAGFSSVSNANKGGFVKKIATFGSTSTTMTQQGTTQTIYDQQNGDFSQAALTITATSHKIQVKGTDDSGGNIFWSGWVKLSQFFNSTGD